MHLKLVKAAAQSEDGQALIEMAITSSVFVALLAGVMMFGQIVFTATEVSNAAKAGAQYGAQNGGTANDSAGIANAAANDAPSLGLVSGTNVTSSVACACYSTPGTAISPCDSTANGKCNGDHLIATVTVNTTYTMPLWLHVPGFGSSITLTGRDIQMCGQ
jgi:Flp pilus assembly protein TadG